MEGLKSRILIRTNQDRVVATIYDIEELRGLFPYIDKGRKNEKLLNPVRMDSPNSEITVHGVRYRILYILTKFLNLTSKTCCKETKMFRLGKNYPYNFQITYIVEPVNSKACFQQAFFFQIIPLFFRRSHPSKTTGKITF